MFPDNLYISDPLNGMTYIVENDMVNTSKTFATHNDVYGYLICQNMTDIYTVNRSMNSVSLYKHLECIGDIRVGKTPWGICEDPKGVVYVTNYADNTVSVIENDEVVAKIMIVGSGPRGIISDSNGVIYVACYLSNNVCKIVNRTVVDSIQVDYNPDGITCNPNNEVWVACSGSNTVIKIDKDNNKTTIPVGRCPNAIVADRRGNVFVTNFEDDTINMISTVNGSNTTIPVGDGPNAISVNSKGFVYITSSLSGEKIYKFNPNTATIVDMIEVCQSQSAYGDFTGCSTYDCFHSVNGYNTDGFDVFKPATDSEDGEEGVVPAPAAGDDATKFLNAAGQWAVPFDVFKPATSARDGEVGAAPAPKAGDDATKYLNAMGQWERVTVDTFVPATASADGKPGSVPAPAMGDGATKYLNAAGQWAVPYDVFGANKNGLAPGTAATDGATKFLNAAGQWAVPFDVFATDKNGLVPAPNVADATKFLNARGQWAVPYTNFKGATENDDGEFGLVPTPTASVETKFISNRGNWITMQGLNKIRYYHETDTDYEAGEVVHIKQFPFNYVLEAVTSGHTATTRPDFTTLMS